MNETILTNCRIVTASEDFDGTVSIERGVIRAVGQGRSMLPGAEDLDGDILMPGLVELHTDNLEKHVMPRPGAYWPALGAVVAHDQQVAAAGITTVLDALALGTIASSASLRKEMLTEMTAALATARAEGLLKSAHFLHLRCEVSDPDMIELLDRTIDAEGIQLISVMDHTPGQRQFTHLETYRTYYMRKMGFSDAEMDAFIDARIEDQQRFAATNRRRAVEVAKSRGISLASHDDASRTHVAEAVADGMTIAEFPTTVEAAEASHNHGLAVMMGGPNLVRGGSHSGNVSAWKLAESGYLDAISSDYAPVSLLHGAMMLADDLPGYDLAKAVATVTRTPAHAAGFRDRGEIAPGLKADLLRVRHTPHHPIVRAVWRDGIRIA